MLRVRGRDVRWRLAAAVGGIGALLYFLANWNAQPLAEFNYPTTDSYASFLAQEFLRNLTGALAAGGLLFVLTAGAEPLYRERYRARLPLGNLFSRARPAQQAILPGHDPGPHAGRHLRRLPDGLLHGGLPLRRLVARRRAL